MNANKDVYKQIFIIDGQEYLGKRNLSSNIIIFPEAYNLDIIVGQSIIQSVNGILKELIVEKVNTMTVGILMKHRMNPAELTISVEVKEMPKKNDNTNITISNMNASQIQVGNNNTQITNITIQELIEKVAKTNDKEAKSSLRKVLENPTVAAVLGSATAGLIGLL